MFDIFFSLTTAASTTLQGGLRGVVKGYVAKENQLTSLNCLKLGFWCSHTFVDSMFFVCDPEQFPQAQVFDCQDFFFCFGGRSHYLA